MKFTNLGVRDFHPKADPSKNNTSSALEFEYNVNSTISIMECVKPASVEYPAENKYPPYWKYLSSVVKWDKYLGKLFYA